MFSNRTSIANDFKRAIGIMLMFAVIGFLSGFTHPAKAGEHSTPVKSSASINVNAVSATHAAVSGIGTSSASMTIAGTVTAGAGGTSSKSAAGVVAQSTSNFTAVGYDVSTQGGTGSFAGTLNAAASANVLTGLGSEHCDQVTTPLTGATNLISTFTLSGTSGQGGFIGLDSSANVNAGVTKTASTIDNVPTTLLTGTVTRNDATSAIAATLLTVDGVVLAPAAVQTGDVVANASTLLGKVVTTTPK